LLFTVNDKLVYITDPIKAFTSLDDKLRDTILSRLCADTPLTDVSVNVKANVN